MKYGDLPTIVKHIEVDCKEMMFYQYLPIKLIGESNFFIEQRLEPFSELIMEAIADFKKTFGIERLIDSYIYLTAKRQFQSKTQLFNRAGYHADGFLTEDINYIWSDSNPTIFNTTEFDLTLDDEISLKEMEDQAKEINELVYPDKMMLRLNQFNIHKVNERITDGFRTFVKISFSKDRYDLEGNAHNSLLEYSWRMKPRKENRNIPQSDIEK